MDKNDLLNTDFEITDLISWRNIDGEILILDTSINESAHELNEIGSFIFLEISQGAKLPEIRETLVDTYRDQFDREQIEKDFQQYIEDLIKMKLLVPKK